jgi:uncharacterized protein (TIGR00299 family) protein
MKLAYFDCISGISGNMTLGALLACGLPRETLVEGLGALGLDGWDLRVEPVLRRGIAATYVDVHTEDHHHSPCPSGGKGAGDRGHEHGHHHHHAHEHEHEQKQEQRAHPHRGLTDILALINGSDLSPRVKALAGAVFTRLGEAEAAVHGTTPDQVHFHEVGAIDAIVDIVGTAIGIEALGIERVVVSPLPLGRGWINAAHGTFPLPAPATLALLRGVPIVETEIEKELVTPTGAAIAVTLAERFGTLPSMTVRAVGYGAGSYDLPRPNVLRLVLGETAEASAPAEVVGLETNLDDVPGEVVGYLMDRLFAAGALDVFLTPIQMKKNRPGVLVRVLCALADEGRCTEVLFRETTTLGVRRMLFTRTVLAREVSEVDTPYGRVRIKHSAWSDVTRAEPEYDDCRRLAEEHGVPLMTVYDAARKAANG